MIGRVVEIVSLVICIGFTGWLFWYAFDRSRERSVLALRWACTVPVGCVIYFFVIPAFKRGGYDAIFGLILMVFCGVALAGLWAGTIAELFGKPFAALYDGGDTPPEPKPLYSAAISKRQKSKPLEAIMAVREQLAKFPNDYEGTMLIAAIQAEDLKDLPSAEITLNHFCEWEKAPPKQVVAAFTQLADWHLRFYQDADSARTAMERIIEKFPDSDLALVAKQRIAHLAGTGKHLQSALDRKPVFVPEGVKSMGLLESSAHLVPAETPAEEQAGAYVKHLQEHPDDTEAREKLAVLYVLHYKRLDLATIELEQLINEPNHPAKRIAHWLNVLADLQIRGGADYETARATLEQIVERFPDYAVADVARSRLAHLKLEFKALEKTPNKTMGVYEQNIGLKGSRGY